MQEKILSILRRNGGHATSAEIQAAAGVSQPTVSRALSTLISAGNVLPVGAARSKVYLLPRAVRGIDGPVPICKVDEGGVVTRVGRIIPISSGYWLDAPADWNGGAYPSLPWFIVDMKPQGFLGRAFARRHADLGLPTNPSHWSDDDVLRALCTAGHDLIGNLIIGARSLEIYHQQEQVIHEAVNYPQLALQAMLDGNPGSSAGGEQPKFCVRGKDGHVLVKFSSAEDTHLANRSKDLLIAEHHALQLLDEAGIPSAQSHLIFGEGRVFLESMRFDRTANGRVGLVSLLSFDSEFIGNMDNWAKTAIRMRDRGLMGIRDVQRLQFLEAFGRLIGNTDRHYGNISLIRSGNRWALSPVYDFLPMVYAPERGELIERPFNPADERPSEEVLDVWDDAHSLAINYWLRVSQDERISEDMRGRAANHHEELIAPTPLEIPRQSP